MMDEKFPKCSVKLKRISVKSNETLKNESENDTFKLVQHEDVEGSIESASTEVSSLTIKQEKSDENDDIDSTEPTLVGKNATEELAFSLDKEELSLKFENEVTEELVQYNEISRAPVIKPENGSSSPGAVNYDMSSENYLKLRDDLAVALNNLSVIKLKEKSKIEDFDVDQFGKRSKEDIYGESGLSEKLQAQATILSPVIPHAQLLSWLSVRARESEKKLAECHESFSNASSPLTAEIALQNLYSLYSMNYLNHYGSYPGAAKLAEEPPCAKQLVVFPSGSVSSATSPASSISTTTRDSYIEDMISPSYGNLTHSLQFREPLDLRVDFNGELKKPKKLSSRKIPDFSLHNSDSLKDPSLITFSDEDCMKLSVREFNRLLHGLPKELEKEYKRKRRTLKNRKYASCCRERRATYRQQMESINKDLNSKNLELSLRNERNLLKIEELTKEVKLLLKENEDLRLSKRPCVEVSTQVGQI